MSTPSGYAGEPAAGPTSGQVLSGTQRLLNGKPRRVSAYRGEVVLVVNTASECGFTPQFEASSASTASIATTAS